MEKAVNFIFIDESVTEEIDLASLTGLVVPLNKFENIRSDFYKILNEILDNLFPNRLNNNSIYNPPILHANSLLRKLPKSEENIEFDFSSITDEFRIQIFYKIVKIISDHELLIIRTGYSNYKEIKQKLSDDKLYQLNWLNLSRTLDSNLNHCILIPVMEGIDVTMVNKFSNMIWSSNWMRELYPKFTNSLIYANSNNFYGTVFYTQSRYTECIQIVDIISYLLQKKDYIKLKKCESDFAKNIVLSLKQVKSENLINSIEKLIEINNKTDQNNRSDFIG